MKAWIWAAAGAVLLTACASQSHDGRDERQTIRALLSGDAMMFTSFDTDADLRVTNAEIEAGITREFARADTSRDGTLAPLEFTAWSNLVLGGTQTGPYRLDFDRNVDNVISLEEFHHEIVGRAHDYDANEDGVLTRDEFIRDVGQARSPREGGQRRMQPGGYPGGGRGGGG